MSTSSIPPGSLSSTSNDKVRKVGDEVEDLKNKMGSIVTQKLPPVDTVESLADKGGAAFHKATSFNRLSTKKQNLGTWFSDLSGLGKFFFIVASVLSLGIVPAVAAYCLSGSKKQEVSKQS